MTRSRSFFGGATMALIALAASACTGAASGVHVLCRRVETWAFSLLDTVSAAFQAPAVSLLASRPVQTIRACAYASRIVKRERPQLTGSWRMCPST